MDKPPSGRVEPMFVDLDVDGVAGVAAIAGPYLGLSEAHAIEGLGRQAVAPVGQFLGVRKGAAQPFDHAGLAADVVGRANVPGRISTAHRDAVARPEARAHAALPRAAAAAIRRPSSSVVMTPRATRARVTEAIQRS